MVFLLYVSDSFRLSQPLFAKYVRCYFIISTIYYSFASWRIFMKNIWIVNYQPFWIFLVSWYYLDGMVWNISVCPKVRCVQNLFFYVQLWSLLNFKKKVIPQMRIHNNWNAIYVCIYRGVESFISANQFQYPKTWYVISENLYFSFITLSNFSPRF